MQPLEDEVGRDTCKCQINMGQVVRTGARFRCGIQVWLDPGAQITFLGRCVRVGVALQQAVSTRDHI